MATYKEIQGYTVQKLSRDPTASEAAGQLWYNTTTGKFKIGVQSPGAWASGATINQQKTFGGSSQNGTQTAALMIGGNTPPNTVIGAGAGQAESYNGTTWTNVAGSLNQPRQQMNSSGTQTVMWVCGGVSGVNLKYMETFDGTSWSEVNNLNDTHSDNAAAGNGSTNGVVASGTASETWDGTCWTTGNSMIDTRWAFGGNGVSTDAIAAGGQQPGTPNASAHVELWDGTCWSSAPANLTTARQGTGGMDPNVPTFICVGGQTEPGYNYLANCEQWNGSSWTEISDTIVPMDNVRLSGTATAGLTAGGSWRASPSYPGTSMLNTSDEWDSPFSASETVTVS